MYTYTCIKYTTPFSFRKEGKYTFSLFFYQNNSSIVPEGQFTAQQHHLPQANITASKTQKRIPLAEDPRFDQTDYAFFFLIASAIANGVVTRLMYTPRMTAPGSRYSTGTGIQLQNSFRIEMPSCSIVKK